MIDTLIDANIKNDPKGIETVEQLLKTLYTAWKDVIENPRADGVPSPKLQPEDYAKWQEDGGAEAVKENSKQQKSVNNLKLMA